MCFLSHFAFHFCIPKIEMLNLVFLIAAIAITVFLVENEIFYNLRTDVDTVIDELMRTEKLITPSKVDQVCY